MAQDKLDQLQRARRAGMAEIGGNSAAANPAPAAELTPDEAHTGETLELLEFARDMVKASPQPPAMITTPRAMRLAVEKQRMVQRMAESARRRAEVYQPQEAAKAAAAPTQPAIAPA